MTPFGWILIVVLFLATVIPGIKPISRGVNLALLMGVLIWGTGHI